jgi:hypothetical protein
MTKERKIVEVVNNSSDRNEKPRKKRGDSQRFTKEIFIEKAMKIHGDKYDYSKVEYKNYHTKVEIICRKHGAFIQAPALHLSGAAGCPMCAHEKTGTRFSDTIDSFIKKSKEKFGDKFDYSNVVYKNSNNPVELICHKHGAISIKPNYHLQSPYGCPICGKENSNYKRRKTTEEFIAKANEVHGFKYDYSKTVYVNPKRKVEIICPIHGSFLQDPSAHLMGNGCWKCSYNERKNIIFGVGINDLEGATINGEMPKSYCVWRNMIQRCYSKEFLKKRTSYKGCTVCEEWHKYSNFKKWYDENVPEGYDIDKDLSQCGKRGILYSPETCVALPSELNTLIVKNRSKRGKYPIGVSVMNYKYYTAAYSDGTQRIYIGSFPDAHSAFFAYKKAKESHVKKMADEYFSKGLITEHVKDLLYKFEVFEDD